MDAGELRKALMDSIRMEVEGMKASNEKQKILSQPPKYTDIEFNLKAKQLRLIA